MVDYAPLQFVRGICEICVIPGSCSFQPQAMSVVHPADSRWTRGWRNSKKKATADYADYADRQLQFVSRHLRNLRNLWFLFFFLTATVWIAVRPWRAELADPGNYTKKKRQITPITQIAISSLGDGICEICVICGSCCPFHNATCETRLFATFAEA